MATCTFPLLRDARPRPRALRRYLLLLLALELPACGRRSLSGPGEMLGTAKQPLVCAPKTTKRADVATSGVLGNAPAAGAAISGDGRFVAFSSVASNLVLPDNNGTADVFMRDRVTQTTILI